MDMGEKRRHRISKLIVRIKPLAKEDRKKARIMEEFINYQLNKKEAEILKAIKEQGLEMLINYSMRKDLTKREKEIEAFLLGRKDEYI